MLKRVIDIILCSIAIIVLTPLLIPVIMILKLTGEGFIFYEQKRIGQNNIPFNLLKFATMLKNSPDMVGGNITLKNDPRVLPFGRILRKYKINELPQLINVLLGDMSIIGRRPTVSEHFNFYDDDIKNIISKNKPGLSGISSIIFRSEEKYFNNDHQKNLEYYQKEIAPYKGELELWYCKNQSVITDFLLIIATIFSVFMPNFKIYNYFFRGLPKHPIFNPK
ncbi:MAG: lipid carrier--UDP-N-acetylgalactosaminyltransferase [Candidatus Marinimicrobia bacterium]|nr:lipid carrier--UDP-N-acetylgalactosaminyltransferase [Candidatus Neomarinimicrobiota bacterium]|tara:strand:+ start:42402 stop:43067 length:666 start_codon:yes stop_codon:yes gene_type:complete